MQADDGMIERDILSANGMVVMFSRCNAIAQMAAWTDWLVGDYMESLSAIEGVRSATHWALTQQPTPGMPSVGFSHVSLVEIEGELDQSVERLTAGYHRRQREGSIPNYHCLMNLDVFEAHGRWCDKPLPDATLTGHIMAYVMCNDPSRESEWDLWNDDVHMPDMLASDGFTGVSRWRRRRPTEWGAQYLTLYDVGTIGIEAGVERSAAVMPGIVAAGRKLDCHVGGLTVTLSRANGQ